MTAKNGVPCLKCGTSRWYKSGNCVQCSREATQKWRRGNPERAKELDHKYTLKSGYTERKRKNNRNWLKNNRELSRLKAERWKKANPEKAYQTQRKWRQENIEKVREYSRRWARNNKESIKEYQRKWRKENPEKHKEKIRRYWRRLKENGGSYTDEQWQALCTHYGNKCLCCGQTNINLTPDHIVPISKGGNSNIENIQPLCLPCNVRKGTKTTNYRQGDL